MNTDTDNKYSIAFSYALPAFFYLVLTLYLYTFSQYGLNVWDEGGFAYGTLRTYNGQSALRDFNPEGYPPGRYLYATLFFKLFGINFQSLRLCVVLITPAMVLMVYAIARKIMPRGFSVLAALCMLSAPSMYYNRFYPFFCALNLYCLVELLEKRRVRNLLMLCISIILALYFKFEVGVFSIAVSITLIPLALLNATRLSAVLSRPAFQAVIFVSAVLGSATIFYFIQQDSLEKVVSMVFKMHNVWGNPFPEIFPFAEILKNLGPHEMFERVLFYLPIATYFISGIVLVAGLVKGMKDISTEKRLFNLHLAAILFFGICAFGLVVWRAGFDNLLRTLPPFYILFCYLINLAREKMLSALKNNFRPPPLLWLKTEAVELLALSLPLLFVYEMNMNHGFYAGSIGAIRQETARLKMDRIDVYTRPEEAEWIKKTVNSILAHTQKGDPILALPLNPIFYFLADRPNPIQYDWILPGMLNEEKEEIVLEQLEDNPPKMIIYVNIAIDGKEERRFSNYCPKIFKFIDENYRRIDTAGYFQILILRK